jgi:glycerol-3-phosphate dehydrogenase
MTNVNRFSMSEREKILHQLGEQTFDLLIIGGGITGAGIALDAASRGLKTALIEKNDFAFGTSSRSTKLIHGGLRYLKQLEFGLVKEVGSERAIVHRLARHLVIPEKMLLPLSEKKGLGYWLTSIGLMVYDYLAGVKPQDQRRMLTRKRTLRYEPLLKKDDIKGGAIYAEYRTDDARLTIEIAKTAHRHGATMLNYVRATEFGYGADGKVNAVLASDELGRAVIAIKAKTIVNAAGPWVDELRDLNKSKIGKRLHLTKGVHVVVSRLRLPVSQSIYFDVDDGRMIFAIPRGRTTYIGTTDTNYTGSIEEVYADKNDAEYLLRAVNATFPTVGLTLRDIESSWAGLRPLIHEDGKSASQLSRKDEIFESPTGLISIAGGKLTGYRKMSERVVNLVIKKHFSSQKFPKTTTAAVKLTGADFNNWKSVRKYLMSVRHTLKPFRLEQETEYLVHNYGRQTDQVISILKAKESLSDPAISLIESELQFCFENEMITSLADFFNRRTGMVYFNMARVERYKDHISVVLKNLLNWPEQKRLAELTTLNDFINKITSFKNYG